MEALFCLSVCVFVVSVLFLKAKEKLVSADINQILTFFDTAFIQVFMYALHKNNLIFFGFVRMYDVVKLLFNNRKYLFSTLFIDR